MKFTWDEYTGNLHTDQDLLFDSHHSLELKSGVVGALQNRAESVPTSAQAQEKGHKHVRDILKACGYPRPF